MNKETETLISNVKKEVQQKYFNFLCTSTKIDWHSFLDKINIVIMCYYGNSLFLKIFKICIQIFKKTKHNELATGYGTYRVMFYPLMDRRWSTFWVIFFEN